jgi:ubiquinone/menaquinone biosynthesis C-methylase UbiE
MKNAIVRAIDTALANPFVFGLQQRLCNDYGAVATEFQDWLAVSGKSILEVGCSVGTSSGRIVDMRRNAFHGIDIVARYVRLAARRYPQGQFHVMDARAMTFDDRSFDIVIFSGVLHHMADDVVISSFKEVRRVLRPDGVVLLAEPVYTPARRISTLLLNLDRGRHIRSAEGYARLFSGFETVRQRYFQLSLHRFCSFVLKASAP